MPRERKLDDTGITFKIDPRTIQRLEKVAPVRDGERSAFIRQAVLAALDQAEAKADAARDGAA